MSTEWRLWEGRDGHSPDLTHLPVPMGVGLRSAGLHCGRTGVQGNCGSVPGPLGPEWSPGRRVPSRPRSHPALPFSTPMSLATITRLRTGGVVSSLLTSLSQSLAQMPRCTEGWVASDRDPREKRHWEEEAPAEPTGSPGLLRPGQPHGVGVGGGCPLHVRWLHRGAQFQMRGPWEGSVEGRPGL